MATKAKTVKTKNVPEVTIVEGIVIPSLLNVREEASPTATILKTINKDDKIKIIEDQSTEKYYRLVDGGWVLKTLIKIN